MPDLSVIIPGRNERWLLQTIESIRSAIRGDTEIIAVIDGEEAEPKLPPLWPDGPTVTVLRHAPAMGQRASVNRAAQFSTAKYILKTDAHSMLDEGFDVKLMADCEYNWTVLPRMYNLHAYDLVCDGCGTRFDNHAPAKTCPTCGHPQMHEDVDWRPKHNKTTDWMWFTSFGNTGNLPIFRIQYWDGPTKRRFPQEYAAHHKWSKRQGEIADVMNGQGACWFLHRQRFWDLGGLDEAHGSWGQMGIEIACKTWLSGGRHVVNRKTWFAHLFRGGDGPGFPYKISGHDQDRAREYSQHFWRGGKWDKQVHPIEWLIEKFWPVPTWPKPQTTPELRDHHLPGAPQPVPSPATIIDREPDAPNPSLDDRQEQMATIETLAQDRAAELTPPGPDLTVLYYTDGSLPPEFAAAVLEQLGRAAGSTPIVQQRQPDDWPHNHESIYRNIMAGLEQVQTPYVALAEHDVLYPEGYFDYHPKKDVDYNINRWCLHADRGIYSRRREWAMSQIFARTDVLRRAITERLQVAATYAEDTDCFEPGKGEIEHGLTPLSVRRFKSKHPTLDISGHGYNLTGRKTPRSQIRDEVPYWGQAAEVLKQFHVPGPRAKVAPAKNPPSAIRHPPSPKVSVLIPARNEEFLEATVNDLLKNLRLSAEILVGWDGGEQAFPVPQFTDYRVRVIISQDRIGMRPMINRLAREARGEYLLRMDAHCMIDEAMDAKLVEVCEREGHVTVVAKRFELDTQRWQRREKTDTPCRRLTHVSEDGRGLRSLPWPEYDAAHAGEEISETMTCSGSSWTCRRSTFVDWWGGLDERHGTFGQEGVEISCMTWLSGGRFLVHKGTWYAHWNRGQSTYSLGAREKPKSIEHSHWLWEGNNWKHARYGFDWLIEKFHPPGWPAPAPLPPELVRAITPHPQRALVKTNKRLLVKDLWDARDAIADPGKMYRLQIFWKVFDAFVRGNDNDPAVTAPYRNYLISHLSRDPGYRPTPAELKKVEKTMTDSRRLAESVAKEGLKAPLEFFVENNRLILWKGYRRLVIARAVGIPRVVGRVHADRKAAGQLSPQLKLTRLQNPPIDDLHRLAEDQFRRWGNGATDKYFTHGYTRYYDVLLHPIRRRVKKVLELGLLNGASLALWRDYFPKAELVGVDIDSERWKKFAGDLKRCTVLIGDETDAAFMRTVAARGPYDLIVDDASHDPLLQRQAFEALWPAVRQYGFYAIEDTFRGYDGGEREKPPALPPGFEARIYGARDVLAIHHYYNISVVQKA